MDDILIVGGGIAGVSAGAKLAAHAQIRVLEAEAHTAHHASGRSAAAFVPGYGNAVISALTAASEAELRACDILSPRGMMLIAQHGEDAAFDREAHAFGLTEASVEDACVRVPVLRADRIARVGTKDAVWDLDTDALIQAYSRAIRAAGGHINTDARVTEISRSDGSWRVQTPGGPFEAKTLINAAGAWADEIAAMAGVARLGIQPHRRSVARIPAPDGIDVSLWPFLDGVNERWYAKPDAGALLVSPADEEPIAPFDAWAEDETLAIGIARFQDVADVAVERMLSNWAGLRSFAPDRALVLGREPDQPDFVWCAGQGGYGFQTAPGAADLLAAVLTGQTPDLNADIVAALSPARFR